MSESIEQNHNEDFSFNMFSKLRFYEEINHRLLKIADISEYSRIMDLGCGTGSVTKQILDKFRSARETVIYAVDHSSSALKIAKQEIGERKNAALNFVRSEVQMLSQVVTEPVDAVVYCNSIHYVPDKNSILKQIRERLRPGGILAMNTSFYKGSHPEESIGFYKRWMIRSRRIMLKEHGLSPKVEKTSSRQHLSPEEYGEILNEAGFKVAKMDIRAFRVPFEGWHHISNFSDWIEGAMPGTPLEKGRDALQKALVQIFEEMNLTFVPRKWLSITAVRV